MGGASDTFDDIRNASIRGKLLMTDHTILCRVQTFTKIYDGVQKFIVVKKDNQIKESDKITLYEFIGPDDIPLLTERTAKFFVTHLATDIEHAGITPGWVICSLAPYPVSLTRKQQRTATNTAY